MNNFGVHGAHTEQIFKQKRQRNAPCSSYIILRREQILFFIKLNILVTSSYSNYVTSTKQVAVVGDCLLRDL